MVFNSDWMSPYWLQMNIIKTGVPTQTSWNLYHEGTLNQWREMTHVGMLAQGEKYWDQPVEGALDLEKDVLLDNLKAEHIY